MKAAYRYLIFIVLINSGSALYFGRPGFIILLSAILSGGFGYVICDTAISRSIVTNQDGCISRAQKPGQYWLLFSLLLLGFLFSVSACWLPTSGR